MKYLQFILLLLTIHGAPAQKTIEATLEKYNRGTIAYINADEMPDKEAILLLDTRSWDEYQVSHLEHAVWVGYEQFESQRVLTLAPDKDTPLIVYCSVGVRSEDVGERLEALGYSNVKNLYGGIFEWKPVIDNSGRETNRVHAYSKQWGKLLENAEKVY